MNTWYMVYVHLVYGMCEFCVCIYMRGLWCMCFSASECCLFVYFVSVNLRVYERVCVRTRACVYVYVWNYINAQYVHLKLKYYGRIAFVWHHIINVILTRAFMYKRASCAKHSFLILNYYKYLFSANDNTI